MMINFLKIKLENRNVGLDVMRSFAILIVVFGHYINFFNNQLTGKIFNTNISFREFFDLIITGFDGVDLFFVLSGFLIGHSLLKTFLEKRLDFKYLLHNFWIKRWFRTLPNYLFVLLLLGFLSLFIPVYKVEGINLYTKYFVFVQNIVKGELVFFPESWSLSVEEWFYILFPIILTCVSIVFSKSKNQRKALLFCIISYILAGILLRIFYTKTHNVFSLDYWNRDIRTAVIMRFDAIIYGVLMAYFKIYHSDMFFKLKKILLLLGLLIIGFTFKLVFISNSLTMAYTFHYSFIGIGMMFFIPYFYHLKINNKFFINFFTFISVISYSIYLVNYSLVQHLIDYFISDGNVLISATKIIFSLFLTLSISMILFKYIESPFMNIRKKILASRDSQTKDIGV